MENLKYFTPSIEDIKVGYECETLLGEDKEGKHWKKITIQAYHLQRILKDQPFLRVPYLTKEQIEAEGWKPFDLSKGFAYRAGVPSYRHGFTKGNYFVVFDTRKYHIEIGAMDVLKIDFLPEFPETFRVTIPCKDINTFRYINKLLGI